MIKEFPEQRVVVIDGNECLKSATKKAQRFSQRAGLKLTNSKELLNLIYHFFIVESLSLKRPLKLKFRCTIVFYTAEIKSQLVSEAFFNYLFTKLKKTSPIPVFLMKHKNDVDLPYAASSCLDKDKSNLHAFYKHINNNSLTALKNMFTNRATDIDPDQNNNLA